MSLRALIEGRQRRTASLPILVGDLGAAAREVATFRAALQAQQQKAGGKDTAAVKKARRELEQAQERQAACVAEVELQALPADEWEALFGPIEPDEDGGLDLSEIHAVALAASCIDPELQDADWWAEQLKGPQWTSGDRAAITQKLLELNTFAPTGFPGKG